MPKQSTIDAAKRDKAQGKSANTQAGEFVKEEMDKIRSGETGARNTKQAIAIGLSEARRSGVDLKAPAAGKTSEKTRKSAESALEKGQRHEPVDPVRSRAREKAMKKEAILRLHPLPFPNMPAPLPSSVLQPSAARPPGRPRRSGARRTGDRYDFLTSSL